MDSIICGYNLFTSINYIAIQPQPQLAVGGTRDRPIYFIFSSSLVRNASSAECFRFIYYAKWKTSSHTHIYTEAVHVYVCVCVTFRFAACKLKASWLWTADVLQAICNSRQKEHMLANRRQTKDLSGTKTATATMCDVHMQRVMPEILERRRRRRKTVKNGEPQAHKHAQQHTTHYHVYAALCVPARCEFHSIYKHIYFPFFLCFSLFFFVYF